MKLVGLSLLFFFAYSLSPDTRSQCHRQSKEVVNLFVVVILIMLPRFCAFALLSLPLGASAADNPTFMLVSGISAPAEMCVSVENGMIHLQKLGIRNYKF